MFVEVKHTLMFVVVKHILMFVTTNIRTKEKSEIIYKSASYFLNDQIYFK